MQDISKDLQAAVLNAIETASPLNIQGLGGKSFYGRQPHGRILSVHEHRGILHYEPTELVITARCGTPIEIIESTLAAENQMLGFEPPYFRSRPTLGGAVASGLSGPRRPFAGSVRDFMLGCRVINGHGEILSFGGEVMKNVAGYDLSRLICGSLGTLALILEVSLKVIPRPEIELTLRQEIGEREAIEMMNQWQVKPLPISALAWNRGFAYVRLSGGEHTVNTAVRALGGEKLRSGGEFWNGLRDQRLEFFGAHGNLWRLALASAAPVIELPGHPFYDWGGAQRWVTTDDPPEFLFETAARFGGHATLFRAAGNRDAVFQPLSEEVARIHKRLKMAFDPHGIFNPGRMYPDW